MTTDLITPELVRLDADLGPDKASVIRALAATVDGARRAADVEQLVADLFAREETSATGLPGGIAIPHCRTTGVEVPTLAFARLAPPVAFGAKDGPADLAFLIAAPAGGDADHLKILTQLARALVKPAFTEALRSAADAQAVVDLVLDEIGEATPVPAAAAPTPAPAAATSASAPPASLVAVTACPTGIAHTYMAAEALEAAAERAGVEIHVETQGSAGATPLTHDQISRAGAVIFAVDVGVRDRGRFAGKPMVSSGVKRPVNDADAMIAKALRYAADPSGAPRVEGDASATDGADTAEESWGARTRRVLMTGVSYMIPFVAAGGLLIALGFLLGGYEIAMHADAILGTSTLFDPPNLADYAEPGLDHALFGSGLTAYLGALLFKIGALAFGFLVPALAGYIAFAIADRPGITPGFVMGAVAGFIGSGFLGGIVGGVLAGLTAHWISTWRVPAWARGLMPVLVIPLLATLLSGFAMIVVLGKPLGNLMDALNDGLNSMQGGSAVLLGIVLGLMMAFDMGGPLNKTAYTFATAGITAAAISAQGPQLNIMAAVMLAGMVPPLALALATVVRPGLFTVPERENGKAAWAMGASFITEGAIPFAAADPLRVIPSIMAGSAVTGALSMGLDVTLAAPHGGVFVLFAVGNVVGFLASLVAGTLVAAGLVIALKSLGARDADVATI